MRTCRRIIALSVVFTLLALNLGVLPTFAVPFDNTAGSIVYPVNGEKIGQLNKTGKGYHAYWQYWSQGASSYSSMQSYGCWMVAQSKLLVESGVCSPDPSVFNPDKFYEAAGKQFCYYADDIAKGKNIPFSRTYVDLTGNQTTDAVTIMNWLNSGYYCILYNGSHYVYVGRSASLSYGEPIILNSFSSYSYDYRQAHTYKGYKNYNPKTLMCFSVGTTPVDPPKVEVNVNFSSYASKESIGETSATVAKTISVTGLSISSVSKVGVEVYNSGGTKLGSKSETPSPSGGVINAWYEIGSGKEVNVALSPATTYKYRFFATIPSGTKYSDYYTVTTKGTTPPAVTVSFADYSAKQTVGMTTATLAKTISVSGASISSVTRVGAVLYNNGGTQLASKSETPSTSGGVINAWYTVGSGKELNYALSAGTTYKYRFFATISGTDYYSGYYSFTTDPDPTPVYTVSFANNSKQSIGVNNATLAKTISVSGTSISSVTSVGVALYNNAGTWLAGKTEKPTPLNGVINAWYDVKSELGYTLSASTTYKFRFLAVIGGTTYYSEYFTFTTGANTVTVSFAEYSAKQSIGTTNATLAKTISVTGTSISSVTSVGIDLYDSAGSRLAGKTEKPTPKDGVINAWYNVNTELGYTLAYSTSYRYRFLAVIGGTTYYSPYYTFTTGSGGITWTEYSAKQSIGTTNATLARTLAISGSISNVTSVGIRLYNNAGTLVGSKTEKPTPKDGVINMWYDVNSELGVTLTPGAYYTYCFTAVISGGSAVSPTYSFTALPIQGTALTVSPSALTLDATKGTTGTLTATVSPSNATDKSVTWSSSNAAVATVSGGVVSPVSAGTAVISARLANGVSGTCTVTVKASAHIDSVTPGASTGQTGDSFTWTVSAASTEGALTYKYTLIRLDDDVSLSFNDTTAASITCEIAQPGSYCMAVSARDAAGNATPTVTSAVTTVTQRVDSLTLNRTTATLALGSVGSAMQLQAIVSPAGINTTWSSSNESVVKVGKYGRIEAVGSGTAVVTASVPGSSRVARCYVTVVPSLQTLTLPEDIRAVEAEAFSGVTAEAVVIPAGAATIDAYAFAGIPSLRFAVIPDSVYAIDATAFSGCPDVCIVCETGSGAYYFAIENGLDYYAEDVEGIE